MDGPKGSFGYEPRSVAELQSEYHIGLGSLYLDLSHLEAGGEPIDLTASVGIGSISLVVPADANLLVDGSVEGGQLSLLGRRLDGTGLSDLVSAPGYGNGDTMVIHLSAGLGDIYVSRGMSDSRGVEETRVNVSTSCGQTRPRSSPSRPRWRPRLPEVDPTSGPSSNRSSRAPSRARSRASPRSTPTWRTTDHASPRLRRSLVRLRPLLRGGRPAPHRRRDLHRQPPRPVGWPGPPHRPRGRHRHRGAADDPSGAEDGDGDAPTDSPAEAS